MDLCNTYAISNTYAIGFGQTSIRSRRRMMLMMMVLVLVVVMVMVMMRRSRSRRRKRMISLMLTCFWGGAATSSQHPDGPRIGVTEYLQ